MAQTHYLLKRNELRNKQHASLHHKTGNKDGENQVTTSASEQQTDGILVIYNKCSIESGLLFFTFLLLAWLAVGTCLKPSLPGSSQGGAILWGTLRLEDLIHSPTVLWGISGDVMGYQCKLKEQSGRASSSISLHTCFLTQLRVHSKCFPKPCWEYSFITWVLSSLPTTYTATSILYRHILGHHS